MVKDENLNTQRGLKSIPTHSEGRIDCFLTHRRSSLGVDFTEKFCKLVFLEFSKRGSQNRFPKVTTLILKGIRARLPIFKEENKREKAVKFYLPAYEHTENVRTTWKMVRIV